MRLHAELLPCGRRLAMRIASDCAPTYWTAGAGSDGLSFGARPAPGAWLLTLLCAAPPGLACASAAAAAAIAYLALRRASGSIAASQLGRMP